jgi:hypothetical protein
MLHLLADLTRTSRFKLHQLSDSPLRREGNRLWLIAGRKLELLQRTSRKHQSSTMHHKRIETVRCLYLRVSRHAA